MIWESSIDRVKLYRQGATVTRRVRIEAVEGELPHHIELPNLPLGLHDASVRLRACEVPEDADIILQNARVGLYAKPREQAQQEPDEQELRDLEREILIHTQRLELLDAERHQLASIQLPTRPKGLEGRPPPASPIAARLAIEAFTDDAIDERIQEQRQLRRELDKLQERAAELRDRRRRASDAKKARADEVTKTIITSLRHEGSPVTSFVLELSYFVAGARWAPQYQCYLRKDGTGAVIQQRAIVVQSSGEDWKNVHLELSTADPIQWTELPKLHAIRIGKAQPAPPAKSGFRAPPQGARSLFTNYDQGHTRAQALATAPTPFSPPSLYIPPLPGMGGFEHLEEVAEYQDEAFDDEFEEMVMGAPAFGEALSAKVSMAPEGAAMPAPAPPPSPSRPQGAPSPKAKRSGRRREARPAPPTGGGGAPQAATTPQFSMLRLRPGSDRAARNSLTPVNLEQQYLEILERSGLTPDFSVSQLLSTATQSSDLARHTSLPSGHRDVRELTGVFDYAFQADNRVDVPSDASFHSVPLTEIDAPCALTYVVVPREDTNVYRVASVENPSSAPLLSGPAEIYIGDEYVLTTTLPTVSPSEKFRLGLGVEQAIKCARNTSFEEKRSGSAVVAMAQLWHAIDIEVANNLGRTISCEVRERIPHPNKDAEVVVEEHEVTPNWESYTQLERRHEILGGRRWTVDIEAGQTRNLKAQYIIKIYANNELTGGNRREA